MFERKLLMLFGSILPMLWVGASASPNARANCRVVVDEHDYKSRGGRLVQIQSADLTRFPRGFEPLSKCRGWLAMTGIVQPDGTVLLDGIDRDSVRCRDDGSGLPGKSLWRTTLISARFRSARYKPPQMAYQPVCVRIRRTWSPNAPHLLTN